MTVTNHLARLILLNNKETSQKPSTLTVRLFNDSSFDIEQYHTMPGDIGRYNERRRLLRTVQSVSLFTFEKAVKELKDKKYSIIMIRTPQDYRREITDLKRKIRELEARLGE